MPTPPVSNFPSVNNVYPGIGSLPGIDIKVVWRPKAYNFTPQVSPTGREVIVNAGQYASHEFDLIYNCLRNRNLTEVEFKTLMGFWLQCAGGAFPFKFSNPYDNACLASVFATTDGVLQDFPLLRTFGAGGFGGSEPVGIVDYTQNFNLYVDGVLKPSSDPTWGYTLNLTTSWNQLIHFTAGVPAGSHVLSVDMSYFYYCRFGDDKSEFEQVLYNVWQNPKVTLVSKKGG